MDKGERTRRFVLLCMLTCLLVGLTACGQPKLKESQIKEDIQNKEDMSEVWLNGETLTLEDVRIERRQSNEKSETVYCVVVTGNEKCWAESYYILQYTYFDQGGWYMEGSYEYQERAVYPRCGISLVEIEEQLQKVLGEETQYELGLEERQTDLDKGTDSVPFRAWKDGVIFSWETNGSVRSTWYANKWITKCTIPIKLTLPDIIGEWATEDDYYHLKIHNIQWDSAEKSVSVTYSFMFRNAYNKSEWITEYSYETARVGVNLGGGVSLNIGVDDEGNYTVYSPNPKDIYLTFSLLNSFWGSEQVFIRPDSISWRYSGDNEELTRIK